MTTTLYEGTKRVHAKPMNRGEYNSYRGWEVPADENPADDGYLVEDADGGRGNDSRHAGYISWSPKDVFERSYKELPTSPPAAAATPVDDAIEADPAPRWPQGQAPRVTMEMVNEQIVGETYTVLPSGRVIVCELTLKNGFTVRGESAVVFIENNVPQTGREIARKKAADQIWQLLGYELRTKLANK